MFFAKSVPSGEFFFFVLSWCVCQPGCADCVTRECGEFTWKVLAQDMTSARVWCGKAARMAHQKKAKITASVGGRSLLMSNQCDSVGGQEKSQVSRMFSKREWLRQEETSIVTALDTQETENNNVNDSPSSVGFCFNLYTETSSVIVWSGSRR